MLYNSIKEVLLGNCKPTTIAFLMIQILSFTIMVK